MKIVKKKFDEYNNDLFHKNPNNNLNFYIEAQNQIYDTHIKSLISQLSSNKNKKNYFSYKKYHKPKDELIKDYLTEKKMPQKNILKQNTTKELAYQAIIDTFNLLQTQDKTIDKNKFIKARKNSPLYLPYVEENIKTNTSKYYFSRRKLDKEYPSILSYNFPKVVEIQKKYLLNDLIKYYTKFKSLLNLWLNMHPLADVSQYGIDFDTFFSCTEEICEEEEIFVKKIFDRINTETSGILSSYLLSPKKHINNFRNSPCSLSFSKTSFNFLISIPFSGFESHSLKIKSARYPPRSSLTVSTTYLFFILINRLMLNLLISKISL